MKFFQEVDVDKDNFVSPQELGLCMQKIGFIGNNALSPEDIKSVFLVFDENKDGRISYNELCK
jgi:Ca2+-binding EF-hand superfamily protein